MEHQFSPFPPALLWEKRNRGLLIQVIVFELLAVYRGLKKSAPLSEILSVERCFFPYDWSCPYGHFNRIQEHARLLPHVFSELASSALHLQQLLQKVAPLFLTQGICCFSDIFSALGPFFHSCRENENLIFFLLKHKEEIEAFMKKGHLRTFLLRLHPTGLFDLCERLCDNYHHRGFYFLIPEIKRLFLHV